MKAWCLSFSLVVAMVAGHAQQQQESSQTQAARYDVNGNPIPAGSFAESKVKSGNNESSTRVEYGLDANGQKVPLMSVEESTTVVDGRAHVTKIIRRFDQNGAPASTERIVSDEETNGGGGSTKKTSVYRTDVNGNESLDEQSLSRATKGSSVTEVFRKGSDGSLALAERQTVQTEETAGGGSKEQAVNYKKDSNGELYVSAQEVKETVKKGNQTVETSVQYVRGGQGKLELAQERVTRAVAQPDGTVSKEIDIYGAGVPGLSNDTGQPVLKERRTIEVSKAAGGKLVETTVSRKATVDGGELSAPQVISEAVTSTTKK